MTSHLPVGGSSVSNPSRFVQFCILTYIIGYVIVYQKGYQEFDTVRVENIVERSTPIAEELFAQSRSRLP